MTDPLAAGTPTTPPNDDAMECLRAALAAPPRRPDLMGDVRDAMRHIVEGLRELIKPFVAWVRRLQAQANDPVCVAGLESRYYVRAGLAPYDPGADPRLVQRILAGDPDLDWQVALLTPENRRRVAVAAIRGQASVEVPVDRPRHTMTRYGGTAVELVLS